MASMYDRLGDLLNETLEAGEIKYIRIDEDGSITQTSTDQSEKKESDPQKNGGQQKVHSNATVKSKHKYIYKKRTPELERCYRLLDITVSANPQEVKNAYKQKLKYFHPDKHADNPVLQKVATDKTRQIVEAYKKIIDFLNK